MASLCLSLLSNPGIKLYCMWLYTLWRPALFLKLTFALIQLLVLWQITKWWKEESVFVFTTACIVCIVAPVQEYLCLTGKNILFQCSRFVGQSYCPVLMWYVHMSFAIWSHLKFSLCFF